MKKKGLLPVLMATLLLMCLMTTPVLAGTWQKQNDVWRYYTDDGTMATGWIQHKDVWYYLKDTGEMATGWIELEDKWYYLQDSGAMATGWIKTGGNWYFLYSDGVMAESAWIDRYYVDANGVWVKSR